MKKLVSLLLVLTLALSILVGCGKTDDNQNDSTNDASNNKPVEKTYSLVVVTDSSFKSNGVSNVALALVIDDSNKVVAARFDSSEPTAKLDADGKIIPVESVTSKVEAGDGYMMTAGSWATQAKAFENALVGKTADEIANLDASLYAGCTMPNTTPIFKSLVAKAFAYTGKVTFKTAETFTTGIAIDSTVANSGKISSDIAGVVIAGGKVIACAIDSVEQTYSVENGALVAGTLAVSKAEQGDSYKMTAGSWAKQAQVFANSTVGKTAAELANLETVSDALAAAGCTMQFTTAGYKTTIIAAVAQAR